MRLLKSINQLINTVIRAGRIIVTIEKEIGKVVLLRLITRDKSKFINFLKWKNEEFYLKKKIE